MDVAPVRWLTRDMNDDFYDVWTPPVPTTSWTHVVGTYDGLTVKIYNSNMPSLSVKTDNGLHQ